MTPVSLHRPTGCVGVVSVLAWFVLVAIYLFTIGGALCRLLSGQACGHRRQTGPDPLDSERFISHKHLNIDYEQSFQSIGRNLFVGVSRPGKRGGFVSSDRCVSLTSDPTLALCLLLLLFGSVVSRCTWVCFLSLTPSVMMQCVTSSHQITCF